MTEKHIKTQKNPAWVQWSQKRSHAQRSCAKADDEVPWGKARPVGGGSQEVVSVLTWLQ